MPSDIGLPARAPGRVIAEPSALTGWTRVLLYLELAIVALALFSGLLERQLIHDLVNGAYPTRADAAAAAQVSDAREAMIGVAEFAIFVVGAIVFLRWIHRVSANARRHGALGLRFTPGWAVGWYFVPIWNLWRPLQVMREIWRASADPQHWQAQPVPPLLGWWWFAWLAANALGNLALRLSLRAEELDDVLLANTVSLLADLTMIPLCLLVLALVGRISALQAAWRPPPTVAGTSPAS